MNGYSNDFDYSIHELIWPLQCLTDETSARDCREKPAMRRSEAEQNEDLYRKARKAPK